MADDGFAAGFDDTRTDEEGLTAEVGITYPIRIALKVVQGTVNRFLSRLISGTQPSERGQKSVSKRVKSASGLTDGNDFRIAECHLTPLMSDRVSIECLTCLSCTVARAVLHKQRLSPFHFSAAGNQPWCLTRPRRYSIWPAWWVLLVDTSGWFSTRLDQ